MSDSPRPTPGENRPLAGVRVLLTRPPIAPDPLEARLEELGANVVCHPVTRILPPPDTHRIREIAARLGEFSTLAFMSRHAVAAAHEFFLQQAESVPAIAAIGTGTRDVLLGYGHEVRWVPEKSNSQSMAEMLIEQVRSSGLAGPVLVLRADRGSDVLPKALTQAGVAFEELAVYQSKDIDRANPVTSRELYEGKFDWVTVTSSSIAKNVARLFGDHLENTKVVSISPTTSSAATEVGLKVAAEATKYNVQGLVDAILNYREQNR